MNRNHIVVIIVTIAVSIAVFVAVMFHMVTKKLTSQRTLLKMFHTSIDRTSYE